MITVKCMKVHFSNQSYLINVFKLCLQKCTWEGVKPQIEICNFVYHVLFAQMLNCYTTVVFFFKTQLDQTICTDFE